MFNRKNTNQDIDAYVEERLSDYLDGTLSDKERTIVQAQLATSERARASLEALRYTVNLLKQTPAPALPRQFTLPVTSRAPVQSAPAWLVWGLRGLGAAATAAFVVLLVATLFRPGGTPTAASLPAAAPNAPSSIAMAQPVAAAPTAAAASEAYDADATPIMQTEQAPNASQRVIPVTETPTTPVQKALPPQQDSANLAATQEPEATNAPEQFVPDTPIAEPTIVVAAGASANTGPAPEVSQPTETSEVFTQRMTIALEGQVTLSELIVRAGPGTEYTVIGGLRRNDLVQIMGRSFDNSWLYVSYQKNRKTHQGWASSAYIRVNGKLESVPVTEFLPDETPTLVPEPTETIQPTDQPETPDHSDATPAVGKETPDIPGTPPSPPIDQPGRSPTSPLTEGDNTATPTTAPGRSAPAATPSA